MDENVRIANARHLYECQACINHREIQSAAIDIVTSLGLTADLAGGTTEEFQDGLADLIIKNHANQIGTRVKSRQTGRTGTIIGSENKSVTVEYDDTGGTYTGTLDPFEVQR